MFFEEKKFLSVPVLQHASIAGASAKESVLSGDFLGAVAGGLIGGLISILVVVIQRRDDKRTRDDELFGRAFKAVMDWTEMPFRRIRSRQDSVEQQREIRLRFHVLQEEIQFHRGWIGFRSKKLGSHYDRFVSSVKRLVRPCLQKIDSDEDYSEECLKEEMARIQDQINIEVGKFRQSVGRRRSWYGCLWERL